MPWIYKDKPLDDKDIPAKSIGFLYRITHLPSGRYYLGRKMLEKSKTTQSKGIKKKSKVASDWKDYWSSSEEVKALVAEKGEQEFKREILIFCPTKACLTAGEEYTLHVSGSMFDPLCFNSNIRAKIFKSWFTKTPNFFNELKKLNL